MRWQEREEFTLFKKFRETTDRRLIDVCKVAFAFTFGAMLIDLVKLIIECI